MVHGSAPFEGTGIVEVAVLDEIALVEFQAAERRVFSDVQPISDDYRHWDAEERQPGIAEASCGADQKNQQDCLVRGGT